MKMIEFLGKSYTLEEFETNIDTSNLDYRELIEYENLLPVYRYNYNKPIYTVNGDNTIKSYEKYLDDERYE